MCSKIKWFALILLGIGLDQGSKYLAMQHLELGFSKSVFPYLNWSLTYNRGISFGLFNQQSFIVPIILMSIILALIIGLSLWLWNMPKTEGGWQPLCISLIIGGAIGNLIDRVYLGYVVDFIDFYIGNWHWYTFNLADCFICVGAGMLALYSLYLTKMET
jgi:signal peptidase II